MSEKLYKAIAQAKKLRKLNIFTKETFDYALQQAHTPIENGKLKGRLMTIKDNLNTANIETTCGSRMLETYRPPDNATAVDKLIKAGAIMMGKVNMDEFGMGSVSTSIFGTVKNPWNLAVNRSVEGSDWYISGGSSGGSAASVTAQLCEFSLGSDTGGSIRNPAALCGCIGYKPTYGLISRYGLIPLNNYFDVVGIFSNSIDLLVDVLNVIAGPDSKDATSIQREFIPYELSGDNFDIGNLRIGLAKEFTPDGLSTSNSMALEKVLTMFKDIGESPIKHITLPHVIYSMSVYSVLTSCEVASNFARFDGIRYGYHREKHSQESFNELLKKTRDESLGQIVKSRIVTGNYFLLKENYDRYFLKAQKMRRLIYEDFKKVFTTDCDIIVAPVNYHDTPTHSEFLSRSQIFDDKEYLTSCVNIAGLPAISLPVCLDRNGLPVGIQLIADIGQDELLLNVAKWFLHTNKDNFQYLNLKL